MRIQTLGLLGILALSMLLTPLTAETQQPRKVPQIGWLHPGLSHPAPHPSLEAFRQGLRARGYVEGQNLGIASRFAERSDERLADLAAELVRLQVDVIVAGGSTAIRAAQLAALSRRPARPSRAHGISLTRSEYP